MRVRVCGAREPELLLVGVNFFLTVSVEMMEKMTSKEWDALKQSLADALDDFKTAEQLLAEGLGLREVTTAELCTVLKVSDRRISQLWKEGWLPEPRVEGRKNIFPLIESVQGYIDLLKGRR